ncbi:phage minor head protein [Rahnella contaminans]|uniref:phage head morphogenesis protein n=1 Tax=Rahnella contaminans TaxID=2703882 RepID=UPI003C300D3E
MMSSNDGVDLGVAASLPPKEAISYFESKGYKIGWNWYETLEAAHARAFTVAKCANLDVLNTLRESVDKALKSGMTEDQFVKELTPTLQKMGWWGKQTIVDSTGTAQTVQLGSPRRLATIYQTNTRTAYAAGRYAQQMNQAETFPYWQYVAVIDTRTRASHAELNLMTFRYDDPFWQTHYPPNDWECRCRVRVLSAARFQASGIPLSDSSGMLSTQTVDAGVDPFTGEVYQTTVTTFNNGKVKMTPGAGWSYNVGAAAFGTDAAACRKLIETPNADLRRQFIQTLNNSPARQLDFAVFAKQALAGQVLAGVVQSVGFVAEDIANQVQAQLGQPPARLLTMGPDEMTAATTATDARPVTLAAADVAGLPAIIANPGAVLLDADSGDLLYVGGSDNSLGKGNRTVAVAPMGATADAQNTVIGAQSAAVDTLSADLSAGKYQLIQGAL